MQLFVTFAQETSGVSMPLCVANPHVLFNSVQISVIRDGIPTHKA